MQSITYNNYTWFENMHSIYAIKKIIADYKKNEPYKYWSIYLLTNSYILFKIFLSNKIKSPLQKKYFEKQIKFII